MNEKRLSALDGLRGIAALGVAIFWHYQHFAPASYPFAAKAYWLYHYGESLVDLFFVLSGFIFCHVYKQRILDRSIAFGTFATLRLSRLYPLQLVTLALVAVLQSVRHLTQGSFFVYQSNDVYHVILNVLFIQNGWLGTDYSFNAPSWSVAVEIMAYLVFFAILFALRNRTAYLFGFALVAVGALAVRTSQIDGPLLNGQTSRALIGFFVGCLAFELYTAARRANRTTTLAWGVGAALAAIIGVGVVFGQEALGDWHSVYLLGVFPLTVLAVLTIKPLGALFSIRPLVYLGAISFSVYLLHFPVQLGIELADQLLPIDLNYASRKFFVAYVLLVIGVGALSHRFLELPMQRRIRQRYLPAKAETPAPAPAVPELAPVG